MSDRPARTSFFFASAAQTFRDSAWHPSADVYRTRDGWLLKFELAGVEKEDISVQLSARSLTVSGVRRDWVAEEDCSQYSLEITYNRFERTVHLPCEVDATSISLEYRNGILLVRINAKGRHK